MNHVTTGTKDLAQAPMYALFMRTAFPIIVALMVAGLYNVIDAIYIARGLGSEAMGAVSMIFPLQMFIAASASLVSTGAASLMVRFVGANEFDSASCVASAGLAICLILTVVFTVTGVLAMPFILSLLNVSEPLMVHAKSYAQPILIGAFAGMLLPLLADTFRSEGKMNAMMAMILLASLLNIILDPIFIFTLKMGVQGAAIATVLSQVIALSVGIWIFLSKGSLIRFRFDKNFGVHYWPVLLALGLPIFIAQLSMAVQAGSINYLLQNLSVDQGDLWVSAYGILGRLFTFVFLPLIAMLIAFQTICGFNTGAKLFSRVQESIWVALKVMSVYALIWTGLLLLFPDAFLSLFTQDDQVLELGKQIIHITIWTFPTAGVIMVATGYYQAVGRATRALLFSGMRVFIVFIPLLIFLPKSLGEMGIFLTLPISDLVAVLLTIFLCSRDYRQLAIAEVQT